MIHRWNASVTYRTDDGPLEVQHEFEEISDLHDLIERGPHWDAIISIVVTLARPAEDETMTVEQSRTR